MSVSPLSSGLPPLSTSYATSSLSIQSRSSAGGTVGSAAKDTVSLSELGKSLRGESAIAFNALSDKQRSQLIDLVDSGKMSGEEVHDALKQRLKQARSSAVSATQRMFANDHADLLSGGKAGSGELRDALATTLDRRSSLMDKLQSALGQDGVQAASDALSARDLNPLLAGKGAGNTAMAGFFDGKGADSRLAFTKKEGDAAYKLKSLGVDLDDIDNALRGIGEKDAAAILSERAGLPSSRTVVADADFSEKDAVFLPFVSVSGQGGAERKTDLAGEANRLKAFYQSARAEPVGSGISRIDAKMALPDIADAEAGGAGTVRMTGSDPSYLKGLLTRY